MKPKASMKEGKNKVQCDRQEQRNMEERRTRSLLSPLAKDRSGNIYLHLTNYTAKLPKLKKIQGKRIKPTNLNPSDRNQFRTTLIPHDPP